MKYQLVLSIQGATDEELAAGLAAARAYFKQRDIDIDGAALAVEEDAIRTEAYIDDQPPYDDNNELWHQLACQWREAENTAFDAVRAVRPDLPEEGYIGLGAQDERGEWVCKPGGVMMSLPDKYDADAKVARQDVVTE
jgi:hypothetical protein